MFRGATIATRALALLAIAAIALFVQGAILLYFSIWLLGAAFSRVKIEAGRALRWALLLLLVGTAVYIRMKGRGDINPDNYFQYLLFSLVFVVFLSSMQFKRMRTPVLDWTDRTGRFFANFSFTLYVVHVPMIAVMGHLMMSLFDFGQLSPYRFSHYFIYAGIYFVVVVGAYWLYLPFESNTPRVRQWLKSQTTVPVGPVRQ